MPPKKTVKRKRYSSIVQSTPHLSLSTGMKKLIFSNLFAAGNVLRAQLAFESVCSTKLPVRLLYQFCSCVIISSSNPYPVHNFVPMVLTLFPYVNICQSCLVTAFCCVVAFMWLQSSLLIASLYVRSFLLLQSIVSTSRFRITFTANVRLYHVIKCSLYLSPTVYYIFLKRRFRLIYN